MAENIWVIELYDGTKYDIPGKAVEVVKQKIANKEPIMLKNAVLSVGQIKTFTRTTREDGQTSLLPEEVHRAFGEPEYTSSGGIIYKWVKKAVSAQEWQSYYSKTPAYKKLEDIDGFIWIAFKLPSHQINQTTLQICSIQETEKLERK